MAELSKHSLLYDNNALTVKGIKQVVEIDDKQAVFKLDTKTLYVKGSGFNVVRLDREQGVAVLETATVSSFAYRHGDLSLKGLFR